MRRPSALIDNAAMKFGPEHTRTPGFCGIGLATRVALPLLGKGLLSAGRKVSQSTTSFRASRLSPRRLGLFSRSERSKKPGCPIAPLSKPAQHKNCPILSHQTKHQLIFRSTLKQPPAQAVDRTVLLRYYVSQIRDGGWSGDEGWRRDQNNIDAGRS